MLLVHFRFDFAKNEWSEVAPISIPRRLSAHTVLSGFLFVIGGESVPGTFENSVEYYTPLTDRWATGAPMRRPRASAAACISKGSIYVFGGFAAEGALRSIERYQPQDDSWTEAS